MPRLVEAPLNSQTLVDFYSAVAEALVRWEPRFRLISVKAEIVNESGQLQLELTGEYLPDDKSLLWRHSHMTTFNAIDLSLLPAPDVIETLDHELILAGMIADLQAKYPEFSALVESDPAFKILEIAAYREVILRQRLNDAARAVHRYSDFAFLQGRSG